MRTDIFLASNDIMQPQMQGQVAPQTTVVVQPPPPASGPASPIKKKYPHKQALVLSATQVTLGGLAILFQIVAMGIHASIADVGTGIWCGLLFVFTGIIGVVSSKQRTTGWIVGFMVLSIVSAIFTIALITTSAIGAAVENENCNRYISGHWDNGDKMWISGSIYRDTDCERKKGPSVGMHAVLVCLALVEAIVAIWSSAICCAGACCGTSGSTGTVVYYNSAVGAPTGQVMVINQGQPLYTTPIQTTYIQGQPTMVYAGQPQVSMMYSAAGPAAPPPYAAQQQQGQYPQPGSTNPPPQQGHPDKM